jgi:hypothetical protein
MRTLIGFKNFYPALSLICFLLSLNCEAQVDPEHRALLELGYDQPLEGQGPQGVYAYFYYNKPDLISTNVALRLAVAPVYFDGEIGFKHLISPNTDLGIGLNGGGYSDNYYEVQQGDFIKAQSFNGDGFGSSVSIYHLLDPGRLIPLNFLARGGFHFATYNPQNQTAATFDLPQNQFDMFTRVGFRLAGKEPVLDPDLGMELSVWYEHQWRLNPDTYGFNNELSISPNVDLYWIYAGLNYTFTNSGQKIEFAATVGGSSGADRFSAWRLGGVLPLISEFPLMMPGYYYEELTAEQFAHVYAAYEFPLVPSQVLKFRLEAAVANLVYLPGFEQDPWQSGAGCALSFAPKNGNFKIIVRYGHGFEAIRNGHEGAQSIGVLFQYDFGARKRRDD